MERQLYDKIQEEWKSIITNINSMYQKEDFFITGSGRFKDETSIYLKLSSGKSEDISDLCGLRMFFHGNLGKHQEDIKNAYKTAINFLVNWLGKQNIGYDTIIFDKKGCLITEEWYDTLLNEIPNAVKR